MQPFRWRLHCWDLPSCSILSPPADAPRTPTITIFQETQGGRLAIVRCAVDSHPPAAVALYRDGTLLAASGSQAAPQQRFGVTASRNALRLEIRGVGPQDSGEYRCTASNAYGKASTAKQFVARGESRWSRCEGAARLLALGLGCQQSPRTGSGGLMQQNPLQSLSKLFLPCAREPPAVRGIWAHSGDQLLLPHPLTLRTLRVPQPWWFGVTEAAAMGKEERKAPQNHVQEDPPLGCPKKPKRTLRSNTGENKPELGCHSG